MNSYLITGKGTSSDTGTFTLIVEADNRGHAKQKARSHLFKLHREDLMEVDIKVVRICKSDDQVVYSTVELPQPETEGEQYQQLKHQFKHNQFTEE